MPRPDPEEASRPPQFYPAAHPGQPPLPTDGLTYAGAIIGAELEARLTLAGEGAGNVDTAMLTVSVATFIYVWRGQRAGVLEGQQRRRLGWLSCSVMSFAEF